MNKRQINYDSDKQLTATRLRKAMRDINMSSTELSKKAGISKSSVSHYLHGTQAPSNISAVAMGKILNVSPIWLMGLDKQNDQTDVNEDEQSLLRMYRKLSNNRKEDIRNIMKIFYKGG